MIPIPDALYESKCGVKKHYLLLIVDLVYRKFKFFDSAREPIDESLRVVTKRILHNLRRAWNHGYQGHQLFSDLQDFRQEFGDMPKQ